MFGWIDHFFFAEAKVCIDQALLAIVKQNKMRPFVIHINEAQRDVHAV